MTQATRGEFDAGGKAQLGMAGQLGVCLAVLKEMLDWKIAIEDGEEVLGGYSVSGFVEEDVDEFGG